MIATNENSGRNVVFNLALKGDPHAKDQAVAWAREVAAAAQRELDKIHFPSPPSGGRGGFPGSGGGGGGSGGGHGGGNGSGGGGFPGLPVGPRIPGMSAPGVPAPTSPPAPPTIPPMMPPGPRIPIGPVVPAGGGAGAGAAAAGGLGLTAAGSFAALGLVAAGASYYDTFHGNQYIARSGYGRMMAGAWTGSREWMADRGNDVLGWFSSSGQSEYFDPYGERKSNRMEREILEKRDRTRLFEEHQRNLSGIKHGGRMEKFQAVADQNYRVQTSRDWAKGFVHDQAGFDLGQNMQTARRYGSARDLAALQNQELVDHAFKSQDMFKGRLHAAQDNFNKFRFSEHSRLSDPNLSQDKKNEIMMKEAQLAREVQQIKQEQIRSELTGLEQIRRGRLEEARIIKEAGMDALERLGSKSPMERARIVRIAKQIQDGGRVTAEQQNELYPFAPPEMQKQINKDRREQALASGAGEVIDRGFKQAEANARQAEKAVKLELDQKKPLEVDISVGKPEAIGDAVAKALDPAFQKLFENIDKRVEESFKKAIESYEAKQKMQNQARQAGR